MTKNEEPKTMEELVEQAGAGLIPFHQTDVINVTILSMSKNRILVDVQGLCLGIIPEREFSFDTNELKPGDVVLAYVLVIENSDGHVILSLRRADRERLWKNLEEKSQSGELVSVKAVQANRGGLIVQYGDIEGFLPVSQLAPNHYPKVSGGDKDKILSKLNELIDQTLRVKIIAYERNANKLIFSEKAAGSVLQKEMASQYKVGQKITGKVTGIVDFGLFINIGEMEGLVHISEMSWDRVDDPNKLYKVGDEVEAMVIGIEGGRVSLSIKRLLPDPWHEEVKKLIVGEVVKGVITRATPFGVFVKISDRLEGLVQAAEITDENTNLKEVAKEGKEYNFLVLAIEPETRKITLSLKQAKTKEKGRSTKKKDVKGNEKEVKAKTKSTKKATKSKKES